MKVPSTSGPRTHIQTNQMVTPAKAKEESSKSTAAKPKFNEQIMLLTAKAGVLLDVSELNPAKSALAAERRERIKHEKKLQNLVAIFNMAKGVAISEVAEETIDQDWFHAFIDLAENIYSPVMQELWSKILAVEISRPGSFSIRSLETLRLLTQRDAALFANACKLASKRQGDMVPRLITGFYQRRTLSSWFGSRPSAPINLAQHGLSFPALLALIDLGLIVANEIESAEFPVSTAVQFRCGEKIFTLQAKRNGVVLAYYKYTSVGAELFKLAKRHEQQSYLTELNNKLSPAFIINS